MRLAAYVLCPIHRRDYFVVSLRGCPHSGWFYCPEGSVEPFVFVPQLGAFVEPLIWAKGYPRVASVQFDLSKSSRWLRRRDLSNGFLASRENLCVVSGRFSLELVLKELEAVGLFRDHESTLPKVGHRYTMVAVPSGADPQFNDFHYLGPQCAFCMVTIESHSEQDCIATIRGIGELPWNGSEFDLYWKGHRLGIALKSQASS